MSTAKKIAIEGIWLRTAGDRVEVLVEINGQWKLAISEQVSEIPERNGRLSPVSHIVEPSYFAKSE